MFGKREIEDGSRAWGWKGFMVLVLLGSLAMGAIQVVARRRASPDVGQEIAATLVSWGLSLDGIAVPVDPAEADKWIAQLTSPISESRVQAADWLASHGVRRSAGDIARAMDDPVTRRPCQLAKSLGSLGDDRWADKLILATRQTGNVDLQICATLALGELQSPRAVGALIEVYRNDIAPPLALEALGRIADPSSLEFLKSVAASPRNQGERVLADRAIQRVLLMRQPDPAAALVAGLERQAFEGSIDQWTIRKLVSLRDNRAVPVMKGVFVGTGRHEQVWLAGALLSYGEPGRSALRDLAGMSAPAGVERPRASTARAALALAVPTIASTVSDQTSEAP